MNKKQSNTNIIFPNKSGGAGSYLKEIKVTNYPICIFSDSHCDLTNIKKLKNLYPNNLLLSLGDITQIFSPKNDLSNSSSIDFFIDNNIPTLMSNHEEHILDAESNTLVLFFKDSNNDNNSINGNSYGLKKHHINFLENLPLGFKLILPNGKYYLLYHHAPRNLWGFYDKGSLNDSHFKKIYDITDDNVLGVIHGHCHNNFTDYYKTLNITKYCVGVIAPKKGGYGGNYLLLTEKGLEYKKL